ncbi:MAG: SGNH/GDSL hydrolase family protein [Lachnospiraceae bacterium]|nr:SGNH/GDSL hydrolase family protein [Lachnospiraceae bacterium]
MEKNRSGRLFIILGALSFAAVIFLWIFSKISWSGTAHQVVLMGDSVIGNELYDVVFDEMLAQKLEMEVFNAAFGGTGVVSGNPDIYETYGAEALCFEPLVNAIILQDFSAQNASIERNSPLEYFQERLADLEETDFEKVDILVICFGANDYANQVSPDVFEQVFDEGVGRLTEAFPNLSIYISSPTYNCLIREDEDIPCDSGEWGDYLLEEYILRQEKVAEKYGIPFIDNYHDSVINEETIYDYTIPSDCLHLNKEGREVLSDHIAQAIFENMN